MTSSARPSDPFRVMTYNVRHATLDEGDIWTDYRRDAVAGTIRVRRPDLVALQEAGPTQLESVAERVPGYEWVGAGERTGEYNPVGYRRDRWTLRDHEVRWLSETPGEESAGWDAAFPRVATVASLDGPGDVSLTLFDVHLDNEGTTAGVESTRLLRRWAAARDGPVVVAGDLNCTPDAEPYRVLTADDAPECLRDARRVATHGHHGPTVSFTGYASLDAGRLLDYVFVSAELEVVQHAACPDVDGEGRFPSDHLPLVADLRATGTDGLSG